MRRLALLAFLPLLAIAGCSSPPATVADFSTQLNNVQCTMIFKCCSNAAQKYTTEQACEQQMATNIAPALATAEADIATGDAKYDANDAQRTLDTARADAANCTTPIDVRAFLNELDAVVVGVHPIGSACMSGHTQCAPGSQCTNSVCTAKAPDGTAPDGTACTDSSQCASSRCTNDKCASVSVTDLFCS